MANPRCRLLSTAFSQALLASPPEGGFFGAQAFGAAVVGLWAAAMGFLIFKGVDMCHGLRVPARIEEEGLDIYEHGESVYNA